MADVAMRLPVKEDYVGSTPTTAANLRLHGRVDKCKGLQNPKTVGSNPTVASKGELAEWTIAEGCYPLGEIPT